MRLLFITVAAVAPAALWPALAGADDVDLSGVIRAGYEVRDRVGPEAEAELRLETDTDRETRGVIKLEARYFRDSIDLERAFIERDLSSTTELRFGLDKKRFGLEYAQGNRERLTTDRSLIYEEMELLGLVGRQLSARLRTEPADRLRVDLAAGVDGSRNSNLIVRATREHGAAGYGTWLLFERHRVDKDYSFVWAQALSGWYISDRYRGVLELIAGIDPVRSELFDRRVLFAGPKLELARRQPVADELAIEPLLQASILFRDLDDGDDYSVQLVAGVNLYAWDLVVAVEGQYWAEREQTPPGELEVRFPRFLAQVRYYY